MSKKPGAGHFCCSRVDDYVHRYQKVCHCHGIQRTDLRHLGAREEEVDRLFEGVDALKEMAKVNVRMLKSFTNCIDKGSVSRVLRTSEWDTQREDPERWP